MVGDIRGVTVTFLFLQPHNGVYFKYVGGSIQYALHCKNLTSIISFKVLLGANEMMKMKVFKFYVYFCLQYSLTIPLYDFNLSVLKRILKKVLIENFCSGRCTCYFLQFLNKKLPIPLIIGYPYIPLETSICSCILRHMHHQCLSQCKLNLLHSNQHSKHLENEEGIARSSKTRQKLPEDSRLKRERDLVEKKTSQKKEKARYSREDIDRYTIKK